MLCHLHRFQIYFTIRMCVCVLKGPPCKNNNLAIAKNIYSVFEKIGHIFKQIDTISRKQFLLSVWRTRFNFSTNLAQNFYQTSFVCFAEIICSKIRFLRQINLNNSSELFASYKVVRTFIIIIIIIITNSNVIVMHFILSLAFACSKYFH